MNDFLPMAAPLQGYTEAVFRHFHTEIYGLEPPSAITYYTPFLRLEKGAVRPRDVREISSGLNDNHRLIPQIICRDGEEFRQLVRVVAEAGYNNVDINMGCPFIPQVRKGRGAGLPANSDKMREIADAMSEMPEMRFSVKMRLGISSPDEWREVMDIINGMSLTHLTVHPRTVSQQYSGELHFDEFGQLLAAAEHPVIFNGDITAPEIIDSLREKFPQLAGVMAGRGLLMRPSLFAEWLGQRTWTREERVTSLLKLHKAIFDHYSTVLNGDTQILAKIKPFWEYFGAEFERKGVKTIMKATKLSKYVDAIRNLS